MFGFNIDESFYKAKAVGDIGEEVVKRQLESIGFEVEDVSNEEKWREKDVDFLATKKGRTVKIEVKTDTRINTTNNFCFEKEVKHYKGHKQGWSVQDGWFPKTEADYYAIYDFVKGDIYILKNDKDAIRSEACLKEYVPNSDGFFVDIYLLSIKKAEKVGLLVRKYTEMEILFG